MINTAVSSHLSCLSQKKTPFWIGGKDEIPMKYYQKIVALIILISMKNAI